MKKLMLTGILIVPLLLSAQSNFEGVITYKIITSQENNNYEMKVFYGNNKIKAKVFAPRHIEEGVEIYNFNTGIHYSVYEDEKKYTIDSLDSFSFDDLLTDLKDTALNEPILGHYCRSFTVFSKGEDDVFGELSTVIWFPDSIKFIVPEKYRNKRNIENCDDGNMLFLKMQTIVGFKVDEEDEVIEGRSDTILMIAHKIEKRQIDELEFQIPVDYTYLDQPTLFSHKRDSVVIRELTLTELVQEEEEKPEPPPPPPPKKPKSSKTPAKKDAKKPTKG